MKPPSSQVEFALGTVCTIRLYEGSDTRLYSRIFARLREIDRTMTAFSGEAQDIMSGGAPVDPNSAAETLSSGVIAINRQAGREPVKVRAELIELLEKAAHYAEVSDGAFDPTIGPLVQLWGIGTDAQRIPGNGEIAAALKLVNWRDLVIDHQAGTAFLRREGMALDLGAIAKGYAADEALRIVRDAKIKRAIFDLGGNIAALGWRMEAVRARKKELLPWRIGIQNPLRERGTYIGVLLAHDTSVVTSGVYERYFESGGRRYHHILSAVDGYPIDNGLLSVTIVTESSTAADALATAVFALGYARGKALIDIIPGAEALFVFSDRSVRLTGGLAEIFTLSGNEFALIQ
ncbi:MAG: FAD:protein FMN transferase [Treponema sp.]|nr:FAD:protein FMN transferase [Treponema sp.]